MNKFVWFSRRRSATLLVALALGSAIFPATADDGKPRFVSGAGRDQGDCQNRFRPCRTLSYAIAQAGKGDTIQVAEGEYSIRESRELYDLLSVHGRIAAGFSKYSGYSERNATPATVLIGVPPEFRDRFQAAGFTVIVDSKSLDVSQTETQRMRKLTAQITASERSHTAAPCTANLSAGFACQSVSLLSHLSLQDLAPASARGNDVWGFTDLNTGREYALIGLQSGVAVVDISNPEAPEQVGSATGSSTTWRDIKIYQVYDAAAARWRAYAYVTADSVSDLLLLLDLSNLPNGIARINFDSGVRAAHNAYLLNVDYTFGLAQSGETPRLGVAGASLNGGSHRLYSLGDPRAPQQASVSSGGYAHDLASFPVADTRKNSQCVNAQNQPRCQVLADFNENTVDVWDTTSPSSPQLLSSHAYQNASYVHSGWWTEDGRFLLVQDELDEQNLGLNTTIRVLDMTDLRAPQPAGSWVGPTRAIDHNGYAKGNRYYISNYSEGLTVLDITDPRTPVRIGYFDTYPASSQTGFVGAWGVYPFFASGTIAVADINSGLYLLRNETLGSANGSLSMASAGRAGVEGQTLTLAVNRSGGSSGAVSVQLEVLHATSNAGDATLGAAVLNWADGDAQPKNVTLDVAADGQGENLELMMVRLMNPQGGATIGYPDSTSVTLADAGASTSLRALDPAPAVEEARAKALITMTRHRSASGEARVSYRTLSGGTYSGFTAVQGELVWPDGDAGGKVVTVALNPATLSGGQSGTFQLEFFGAVNAALTDSSGSTVTTLPVTVTVSDGSAAAPPPAPPPPAPAPSGGGGGGGALQLGWLALLGAWYGLLFVLGRPRRRFRLRA